MLGAQGPCHWLLRNSHSWHRAPEQLCVSSIVSTWERETKVRRAFITPGTNCKCVHRTLSYAGALLLGLADCAIHVKVPQHTLKSGIDLLDGFAVVRLDVAESRHGVVESRYGPSRYKLHPPLN